MARVVLAINGETEAALGDGGWDGAKVRELTKAPPGGPSSVGGGLLPQSIARQPHRSAREYAPAEENRGKGARDLEVAVNLTYQSAIEAGFKGSRNQWQVLLGLRS